MYFHRINLNSKFAGLLKPGMLRTQYGSIKYYSIRGGTVPTEILELFRPDLTSFVRIVGSQDVMPHFDHKTVTSLNLYINSSGAVTSFWEPKPSAQGFKFPGADKAHLFHEKDLTEVCSFTANDYETYLLDVSKIHSVKRHAPATRTFVQLSWFRKDFATVLQLIQTALQQHPELQS